MIELVGDILKHLYIVSKPLQFFVADIIDKSSSSTKSELIVVDMFSNSESFYQRVKKICLMDRTYFVKNRFLSFILASFRRPDVLYIDGDIGTRLSLYIFIFKLLSQCKRIYVYEEGIGTYRNDIYADNFKKKLLNLFGVATFFGGSYFCDGVFVFNPERYIDSHLLKHDFEVNKIKQTIEDYVVENFSSLCWLFNYQVDDEEFICESAELYLSSYEVEMSIIKAFNGSGNQTYVKLHPQIKNNFYEDKFYNIVFVDNGVPAELVIHYLSKKFLSVEVKHAGSSSAEYMKIRNVKYELI